jgi:chromosome segregation ATPase
MDANRTINPLTGRQWDLNSLIEKLLEVQDALLQSQERNITLSAQIRELERVVRDAEDMKIEHDNQAQLLADKTKENKYLHQELSRLSSMLGARLQEADELKASIAELQHQLKTSQSDRDLLAIMLTEAEAAARAHGGKLESGKKDTASWAKILKGK